jgi:protein phosphatase
MRDAFIFETGAASHPGLVREINEDSYVSRPEAGLWAVADGMGGHDAGDVASQMVAERLREVSGTDALEPRIEAARRSLEQANAALRRMADERGAVIGSTVAALVAGDEGYACLWSGDSRVYRVDRAGIAQLTRDHTVVEDLVESGALTPDEARSFPGRNVITRAVGASGSLAVDMARGPLQAGDVFVLCSDGLTGHVSDEEIRSCVAGRSCQQACDALIAATLADGASDNVTVIVVRAHAREMTLVRPGPARSDIWE